MVVIDASVIVKLLTEEPGSSEAMQAVLDQPERWAPDLLFIEVASALSKKVRYAGLPIGKVDPALRSVGHFIDVQVETAALIPAAVSLSIELKHAVYDCVYLALAIEQNGRLLTSDKKFIDRVGQSEYGGLIIPLVA
jgi:predicted nucleic acid-binding protein